MNTQDIADKVFDLIDKASATATEGGLYAFEELVRLKILEGIHHLLFAGMNLLLLPVALTACVGCFKRFKAVESNDKKDAAAVGTMVCVGLSIIFSFLFIDMLGIGAAQVLAPEGMVILDIIRSIK